MKMIDENQGRYAFAVQTEKEKKLPFHLIGAGYDFHQEFDPHIRPYGYPHFQWIQVRSGSGVLMIDGKRIKAGPEQGIFLYPEIPHEYRAEESPWLVDWFTFGGYHISELLSLIGIESSGVYSVVNADILRSKISKAFDILNSEKPDKGFEGSALVYDFLIDLMKYIIPQGGAPVDRQFRRLQPVFAYIQNRFASSISLEEMADLIQVTPQHLCNLFRQTIKQRPVEYLNTVRINKSKDLLLQQPNRRIADIAREAGFESASYYSSVFRRLEGVSPGAFKELHGRQSKQSGGRGLQ